MVRTQRNSLATPGRRDQRLVIDGHRDGFAHIHVGSQDRVVEVKVHRLEVGGMRVGRERVIRQRFIGRHLGDIQEPGGVDGPRLQVLEDGIGVGHHTEDDLIQVGQTGCRLVVVGIARNGVAVAGLG